MDEHYLSDIIINLDGQYATQKLTDTDLVFDLLNAIQAPEHSHMSLALKSISMPYAIPVIRTGVNDTLTIECESITGGTVSVDVVISEGSYTASSLQQAVNSQLTALASTLHLDSIGIFINSATAKYRFGLSYSTYALVQISFSGNIYREFGLDSATSVATYVGTTTGTMPRAFNLSGQSQLYVRVANYSFNNRNQLGVSGIISSIPVLNSAFSMLYYEPNQLVFQAVGKPEISKLEIQVLDQDMNGIGNLGLGGELRITLVVKFNWDRQKQHPHSAHIIKHGPVLYSNQYTQEEDNAAETKEDFADLEEGDA